MQRIKTPSAGLAQDMTVETDADDCAHTLAKKKAMRLTSQLRFSVILVALCFSGCASLQPRLGFEELSRNGRAAENRSGDGMSPKLPVELDGSVEKGSIQFSVKFPLFVW